MDQAKTVNFFLVLNSSDDLKVGLIQVMKRVHDGQTIHFHVTDVILEWKLASWALDSTVWMAFHLIPSYRQRMASDHPVPWNDCNLFTNDSKVVYKRTSNVNIIVPHKDSLLFESNSNHL